MGWILSFFMSLQNWIGAFTLGVHTGNMLMLVFFGREDAQNFEGILELQRVLC